MPEFGNAVGIRDFARQGGADVWCCGRAGDLLGVIILSPIIGAVLYAIAGINRIRRKSLSVRRDALLLAAEFDELETFDAEAETVISQFGRRFAALQTLGDRVTRNPLTTGNTID